VTTTANDDLVILGVEVRASTAIAASGGDNLVTDAATTGADLDSGAMLDEVDPAAGSISLSGTFTSASWSALAVALKGPALVSGTVSPLVAAVDAGQTIALTSTPATGGTAPITYQWYTATSTTTCSSGTPIVGATGQSYTTPALPVGTDYLCLWAQDNSTPTHQTVYSNVANITVSPDLSVTITPSSPSIDQGQPILLTADVSGGSGADTYAWYSGGTCSGTVLATTATYTTPALAVNTTYCVAVTDSADSPVTTTVTVTITVSTLLLTVGITPNAPSIDIGQAVELTAEPSGGVGADSYAWYSGANCVGTVLATTQAYTTPALTGSATYCVAATDSAYSPVTATAVAHVAVSGSPLSVTITPHAPSVGSGQTVQLTAHPSGGTGADTYAWYAGSSCTGPVMATGPVLTTPALRANTTYCVAVTDSSSAPVTATATALVAVSSSSSGVVSTLPTYVYPVLGAVVALLVAALLLALLLRRGKKVTFIETGLPEATEWSLTWKGAAVTSTGSSIRLTAAKGQHEYSVKEVAGYAASPASGTVTVQKGPVEVRISFTSSGPGASAPPEK
jgi:Ig-like domain CHU_C associated